MPETTRGAGGGSPTPDVPKASDVWINEFHYDNAGTDVGEFVEVAGSAGTDLSGWTLVGYNGNGGRSYRSVALSGTVPALRGGLGVLAFDFAGLQNGGPDGIALIDAAGTVVEFIAYEGGFTAVDGPADDEVATDIGVGETSGTPHGHSLQRTGRGRRVTDFIWSGPAAATPSRVNAGQEFEPAP